MNNASIARRAVAFYDEMRREGLEAHQISAAVFAAAATEAPAKNMAMMLLVNLMGLPMPKAEIEQLFRQALIVSALGGPSPLQKGADR